MAASALLQLASPVLSRMASGSPARRDAQAQQQLRDWEVGIFKEVREKDLAALARRSRAELRDARDNEGASAFHIAFLAHGSDDALAFGSWAAAASEAVTHGDGLAMFRGALSRAEASLLSEDLLSAIPPAKRTTRVFANHMCQVRSPLISLDCP
jgi:hypothetical protein